MALVGESFEPKDRQKAIGKVMGMMFLGRASATAIGGILAYFGSWRMVYFVYGLAELIIAFVMLRILPGSPSVINTLNFTKVYKTAFSNENLVKVVATIFLVGFSVFGSFTYSGKLVESRTGYIVLLVGLFGFGLAFVSLQSTLVTTAQEAMPKLRGTAMSLASFNMFVGGGIGTLINGRILNAFGIGQIFAIAGAVMFVVAFIATKAVLKVQKTSTAS